MACEPGGSNVEQKIAHLQMIQGVINRMGSNSFAVKGWSITLTAAMFALAAAKDAQSGLILIAYFPVGLFWLLDAFFLRQEKLFRKLYNQVRTVQEADIDFAMGTRAFNAEVGSLIDVALSKTLWPLHTSLVLVIIVVYFMAVCWRASSLRPVAMLFSC